MRWMLLLLLWVVLLGCASSPTPSRSASGDAQGDRPIAYIAGEALTQREAAPLLYEAAGGPVLADLVLDRELARQLTDRNKTISEADLAAERQRLLETLADDPDEAARLLGEVRQERGLGERRFEQLLWRNAALRKLAPPVQVEPVAIQREFQIVHGPRYQPRVLVTDSARTASDLRRRVTTGGEDFAAVAAEASADPSAAVGGLLPPISPADPAYAQALRNQLERLAPGQVSEVLAIDGRYAIVRLERKIPGDAVEWADVRDALAARVRRRGESLAMQRLARTLIAETSVTVLDPALQQSWRRHRETVTQP